MADDSVAAVHTLARRELPLRHPKLARHRVDLKAASTLRPFDRLRTGQAQDRPSSGQASLALPRVDEAFIALGTTIKVAGSQEAFRAVDFDAVIAVAKAAQVAGAKRLGVVSAMGADPRSKVFYSRVKGEMEEALSALGFETLVIARPSLLVGDREALGQPSRMGEELGLKVSRWFSPLIPDNYRPIEAKRVARALIGAVRTTQGRRVLMSGEMQNA